MQFRWNDEKDLAMGKEVAKLRPFSATSSKENAKLWGQIATTINEVYHGAVDYLGVKRRFERILTAFRKKDRINRNE